MCTLEALKFSGLHIRYEQCSLLVLFFLQDGTTPVFIASQKNHVPVMELLLKGKADPNIQHEVIFDFCTASLLNHYL